MTPIDQTFEGIDNQLAQIRDEVGGFRSDIASLHERVTKFGFGLVGAFVAVFVAVVLAVAA
jgi:hypothetical protein